MKKKIITLLTISTLLMNVLVGCGNSEEIMENVTTADSTNMNISTDNNENTQQDNVQQEENQTTDSKQETSDMIGKDRAVEIALAKVPGAEKSDVRIHYDRDDGKDIYEGSIVYNEMEYDFEIDAKTGDILEWESESIYD